MTNFQSCETQPRHFQIGRYGRNLFGLIRHLLGFHSCSSAAPHWFVPSSEPLAVESQTVVIGHRHESRAVAVVVYGKLGGEAAPSPCTVLFRKWWMGGKIY